MTGSTNVFAGKAVLVTGANSGLGFEAAAQLAEVGYGCIILACRTLEKAERARQQLVERVGFDRFEMLAVDVSSIESAQTASDELVGRGGTIDAVLLNAGMVPGDTMAKSADGLELAFASSIVGHHVMTLRLLDAGLLSADARVVIAGSEGARNDLPAMFGMQAYDFAVGVPREFGDNLHDAMVAFARGSKPEKYDPMRYYAATKTFTSWWSAAVSRKCGDRVQVFTVSPGSNMGTNAARHTTGFKRLLFTRIMPFIGSFAGMNTPTPVGAKRYVDVLTGRGSTRTAGATCRSPRRSPVPWRSRQPRICSTRSDRTRPSASSVSSPDWQPEAPIRLASAIALRPYSLTSRGSAGCSSPRSPGRAPGRARRSRDRASRGAHRGV